MSKKAFDQVKRPDPPPFSLRLSWAQRDILDVLAQGRAWGTYIKDVIFDNPQRIVQKYSEIDKKLIAKLLSALGKSRLASNLNQLAKAVNSGSLPVNEKVEKAILQACKTIEWMRVTLIEALGLKAYRPKNQENQSHDPER